MFWGGFYRLAGTPTNWHAFTYTAGPACTDCTGLAYQACHPYQVWRTILHIVPYEASSCRKQMDQSKLMIICPQML
jgi:hypothetical protein